MLKKPNTSLGYINTKNCYCNKRFFFSYKFMFFKKFNIMFVLNTRKCYYNKSLLLTQKIVVQNIQHNTGVNLTQENVITTKVYGSI